jgi:hypothetical protein
MMATQTTKYANYDLDSCIEVARALDGLGGLASGDELAIRLGYSGKNNGAFLSRLASARLYGLVDGQSDQLRPSALAVSILRPDYKETEAKARLEAFERVPLNEAVLNAYHGKALPDATGLRNALQVQWHVNSNNAGSVLARLMDSAEQAGLFSTAGDRTRMIRPTLGRGAGSPSADSHPKHEYDQHDREDRNGQARHVPPAQADARRNKLIDGVLDELPELGGTWSEDELQQWLSFLESALRVVYRLPRPAEGTTTGGEGGR